MISFFQNCVAINKENLRSFFLLEFGRKLRNFTSKCIIASERILMRQHSVRSYISDTDGLIHAQMNLLNIFPKVAGTCPSHFFECPAEIFFILIADRCSDGLNCVP